MWWGHPLSTRFYFVFSGVVSGAGSYNPGHNGRFVRRLLVHLFSKIDIHDRRLLLSQVVRVVSEFDAEPLGWAQHECLWVQMNKHCTTLLVCSFFLNFFFVKLLPGERRRKCDKEEADAILIMVAKQYPNLSVLLDWYDYFFSSCFIIIIIIQSFY